VTTLDVKTTPLDVAGSGKTTPGKREAAAQSSIIATVSSKLFTLMFALAVLVALVYGWSVREHEYLIAESGTGYLLGILGGSMMLLLLTYSMRKNFGFMRNWGALKYWFKFHMLMGVLGPVLILFHSNFGLGSMNSNVALFSMLLVAGSGLIGRIIYSRIHYGLYGRKASVVELREQLAEDENKLRSYVELPEDALQRLQQIYEAALAPRNWLVRLWMLPTFSLRAHGVYLATVRDIRRAIKTTARDRKWDAAVRRKLFAYLRYNLRKYLKEVTKVANLSTYEKLFSLWHVLHIPLFFMMLLSGIVHVIAVHLY
jgi:hypothetical protein